MAYEAELINHLSREIQVQSEKMTALRNRANLAVFLGPYFVLGSFVVFVGELAGSPLAFSVNWIALVVLGGSFLGLGYMSGRIERHSLKQCNRWRLAISKIHARAEDPSTKIDESDFLMPIQWLVPTYVLVYFLLLVSFAATMVLVFNLVQLMA